MYNCDTIRTSNVSVLRMVLIAVILCLMYSNQVIAQTDEGIEPSFQTIQLTDQFYAEGASIADVNGDGQNDVVSGPFWYEGPDFEKHAYDQVKSFARKGYSNHFLTFTHDVTGDGRVDILVVGFPGKPARLYVNPGSDGLNQKWPEYKVYDSVDNESPAFLDLTGDGTPELVCQDRDRFGYVRVNESNPTDKWSFQPISGKGAGGKFTHGLGIGDVNGDGRTDLLEKTGWWEQPNSPDPSSNWTHHTYSFSEKGGAQMFAYDVNGDGQNDVITSLDAHGYGLAWFEQVKKGGKITFTRHEIMPPHPPKEKGTVSFSQTHALQLTDMNGDGQKDIVTGKRWWAHNGKDPGGNNPAVLYVFYLERSNGQARFVPKKVHGDSGVGTQFDTGDLNGDGRPDIAVGNKKGVYVHLQTAE